MNLGRYGVWSGAFRGKEPALLAENCARIEELGYSALWFPGGLSGAFEVAGRLLEATTSVMVATGILNVYVDGAADAAVATDRLSARHPDRFLLGLGISHKPMLEKVRPGAWGKPLAVMGQYLDELDDARAPVPVAARIIAALGPRMLELARDRSVGSHTYLVMPEQTGTHREALGPGSLLAPEQGVVFDTDPASARATARAALAMYLGLPNYLNSWRRGGFDDEDFLGGGSDRLIDSLVAWGDADTICRRLSAHVEAGADHVSVQVLGGEAGVLPMAELTELAHALGLVANG